jgi:hypothetical protein
MRRIGAVPTSSSGRSPHRHGTSTTRRSTGRFRVVRQPRTRRHRHPQLPLAQRESRDTPIWKKGWQRARSRHLATTTPDVGVGHRVSRTVPEACSLYLSRSWRKMSHSGAALEGWPVRGDYGGAKRLSQGRRRGCRACPPISNPAATPPVGSVPWPDLSRCAPHPVARKPLDLQWDRLPGRGASVQDAGCG